MNKKSGLKLSLLFVIVGAIMIAVGTFYGGWKDVKNIVDNSAFAGMTHMSISWPGNKTEVSSQADIEYSYEPKDIEKIDIDVDSATVVFTTATDNKIGVATQKMDDYKCNLDGHTLEFKCDDKQISNASVTIFIPKDMKFEKVKVNAGAGVFSANAVSCEEFKLNIGAGESIIDSLSVDKEANIDIGAGNVTISDGNIEDMKIDVGMGNCDFEGMISDNLEASCGMGNITFILRDSEEDHNYKISTDMGNVTVGDSDFGGFSTKKNIDNGAKSDYEMSCGAGNIELNFN